MGKRSRKRDQRPVAAREQAVATTAPRSTPVDERPKPPWHPFPLIELSVLAGLVLCVIGVLHLQSAQGRIELLFGMVLGSLAGLDTAVREHYSGFKSHTMLLAGGPTVLVAGVLFFVRAPWPALVLAAAVVFAGGWIRFRNAFRRRSGGLSFR